MVEVFFDGNCIVCSTEILYYKRILKDQLKIVDISDESFIVPEGFNKQAMNLKMHVRVGNEVFTGVEAFRQIWTALPSSSWGWKILLEFSRWPVVRPLMDIGYNIFAKYRHLLPKKHR